MYSVRLPFFRIIRRVQISLGVDFLDDKRSHMAGAYKKLLNLYSGIRCVERSILSQKVPIVPYIVAIPNSRLCIKCSHSQIPLNHPSSLQSRYVAPVAHRVHVHPPLPYL
jgi:hypothetical protein